VAVAVAVIVMMLMAAPASASTSPPSARALVEKLRKAGVCDGPPFPIRGIGTVVACRATISKSKGDVELELHAFKSRGAASRGLDRFRTSECKTLDADNNHHDTLSFIVGKTWFTSEYVPEISDPLRATIGGTVEQSACPAAPDSASAGS
jgi:hypothetical protein